MANQIKLIGAVKQLIHREDFGALPEKLRSSHGEVQNNGEELMH